MQAFGSIPPYHSLYPGLSSELTGRISDNGFPTSPFLNAQPWNEYSAPFDPFANSAPFSDRYHSYAPSSSLFGEFGPRARHWSNRDPDPAMLWSRGVSSPCFRHDHHVIIQNSRPPFSAGNWEIDRRHMIEVQFDQFGVASHCRSTWGRIGPWRADRYNYGVQAASSKLQMEITILLSRLGFNSNDGLHRGGQRFDGLFPPWLSGSGYDYPMSNFRYVESTNYIKWM
jgi:hypothetical protein